MGKENIFFVLAAHKKDMETAIESLKSIIALTDAVVNSHSEGETNSDAVSLLFTPAMSERAKNEGWSPFESDTRGLKIQRIDDIERFPSDEDAVAWVIAAAKRGEPHAIGAIQALLSAGSACLNGYDLSEITIPSPTSVHKTEDSSLFSITKFFVQEAAIEQLGRELSNDEMDRVERALESSTLREVRDDVLFYTIAHIGEGA